MGHTGKCICWFERPLWRASGASGSGFMAGTAVGEFHDVTPPDSSLGVLVGFLSAHVVHAMTRDQRQTAVLAQFEQLFPGAQAACVHYDDYLWFDDPHSASPPPSEHPRDDDPSRDALFAEPMYDNRLFWAGSETSRAFPGYLEGAIAAAERAVDQVIRTQSQLS